MNLENTAIISYYSRLVMAKNQGHFKIAQALLDLMTSAEGIDTSSAEGRKAFDKVAQAKGHAQTIAAGVESVAVPPADEASDWQAYVFKNPPYTRKLALAMAEYFMLADVLDAAYEMYLSASELDEDGSSAEQREAIKQAESGEMANTFGKKCEEVGNHAKAATWYKKAKNAGLAEAGASLTRMQAFHGVTRFMAPWLEIAKKTGRKELAEAIRAVAAAANAGSLEEVTVTESVVPPCEEEMEFWDNEFNTYQKFSGDESEAFGSAIMAFGKVLERAKMYNHALRWYKKAVTLHPAANQEAHRMLPLKSKSAFMREAEDIYDSASPIPALWKVNG